MELFSPETLAYLAAGAVFITYADKAVDALRPVIERSTWTWDDLALDGLEYVLDVLQAVLSAFSLRSRKK